MNLNDPKMTHGEVLLSALLADCEAHGGSDLHVDARSAPRIRVQGRLCAYGKAAFSAADVHEMGLFLVAQTLAAGENPEPVFLRKGSVDGAVSSPSGKRYRFNVYREQGSTAFALRRLEDRFRSLRELGLPDGLNAFTQLQDGLVIISGPTGSGKSTTLATLLDTLNRTRESHILTIEDPIEYVHTSARSLVHQRQVGRDAGTFQEALVSALRQDPDILLVGEIRELETIRTALIAAETGHLVFTTLHAGDCVGAIERLTGVFPAEEQTAIRRQLSMVLRGVFAQHLLPRKGGCGTVERLPCGELLQVTPAVANLIASGRSQQIYSTMEVGAKYGMQTLEQDLARLCAAGEIEEFVAYAQTRFPDVLRERIRSLKVNTGRG